MKRFELSLFVSILLVSACVGSPEGPAGTQTAGAVASMSSLHRYRCESGETIVATYASTDSAMVQYQGHRYALKITVSGSGARYVGGELTWWTKGSGPGSEGTLFRHRFDGDAGEPIEICTEA